MSGREDLWIEKVSWRGEKNGHLPPQLSHRFPSLFLSAPFVVASFSVRSKLSPVPSRTIFLTSESMKEFQGFFF